MPDPAPRASYRLRDVVLDVGAYALRRDGRVIRLERQPMDLLILLVERRGQLVTRAEIVDALWGQDVFVDVETGVHTAIRKIRQALRDAPEAPTFIETVPGKGYRFVAPVEALTPEAVSPAAAPAGSPLPQPAQVLPPPTDETIPSGPSREWVRSVAAVASLLVAWQPWQVLSVGPPRVAWALRGPTSRSPSRCSPLNSWVATRPMPISPMA